jgi:GR25 family glycosyltransferase involved in LPS biosynthesis
MIEYLQSDCRPTMKTALFINRLEDAERCDSVERSIRAARLNPKRIEAITPDKLPSITVQGFIIQPNVSVMACLCSHLLAIKSIAESLVIEDWALVAEDDCILSNFVDFDKVVLAAPSDWDVLQLSTSHVDVQLALDSYYREFRLLWHAWRDPHWGAHAYIISKQAALSLTQKFFQGETISLAGLYLPRHTVADALVFRYVNSYTSCFPLAYQQSYVSTIFAGGKGHDSDRFPAVCKAIWERSKAPGEFSV